jgi:transposase
VAGGLGQDDGVSQVGWWIGRENTAHHDRDRAQTRLGCGFNVISRRWVVERTLARLTACRRLARDYERHPKVSEAIIRWAAIAGMTRRITQGEPTRRQPRYTFD